jgi:Flp pilus assembly protein CpaB
MRRGRIFIYLALIVVLGVAAFYLLSKNLLGKKAPSVAGVQTTPGVVATTIPVDKIDVIVSKQDIPRGLPITEDHLDKVSIPMDMYNQGGFFKYPDELNKVVGRIAAGDIKQNRIILSGDLLDTQTLLSGRQEALLIPAEKVAVSIPISRLSSSAYAPQAGDHVNVIVTLLFIELDTDYQSQLPNVTAAVIAPGPNLLLYQATTSQNQTNESSALNSNEQLKNLTAQVASGGVAASLGRTLQDPVLNQTFYLVPSETQRPRMVSQSLIQNVLVLHVGNFSLEETETAVVAPGEPTPTPVPAAQKVAPDIITLVVSPQDAVTLNYLIYCGAKLTLALRSPNDTTLAQTQAVTLDYLVNNYQITLPVKLNFGIEPRVDELVQPVLKNDNPVPTPQR